ncbi:TPA: CaiF/GrlA family transcriptional regulator [Escherichia coli]|nr:CaiF/GrlA family transcriptional regulator [Escherichia coli]
MKKKNNPECKQVKQSNHGDFCIPEEIRHLGDMSLYRAVAWWGFIRKTAFNRRDVSQAFQIDLRRASGIINYICHRHEGDDIAFEVRKISVQGGCRQLTLRILKVAADSEPVKSVMPATCGKVKMMKENSKQANLMARWLLSRPTGNNAAQMEAWKAGCPIYNDKTRSDS